jgi:hypothetical protein
VAVLIKTLVRYWTVISSILLVVQEQQNALSNPLSIGEIPPTPGVVEKFFNDSTGEGDEGETDERGPRNQDGFDYVEAPAQPIAEASVEEVRAEIVKATERTRSRKQGSSNGGPRSKRLRGTVR